MCVCLCVPCLSLAFLLPSSREELCLEHHRPFQRACLLGLPCSPGCWRSSPILGRSQWLRRLWRFLRLPGSPRPAVIRSALVSVCVCVLVGGVSTGVCVCTSLCVVSGEWVKRVCCLKPAASMTETLTWTICFLLCSGSATGITSTCRRSFYLHSFSCVTVVSGFVPSTAPSLQNAARYLGCFCECE